MQSDGILLSLKKKKKNEPKTLLGKIVQVLEIGENDYGMSYK